MQRIFYPRSVVVIGVSERPENLARFIIANLQSFHYKGELYAVGRKKGMVHGIPIASSLDEVPDGLDLAVILTPAATVPELMDWCGRKGISRVVVESGGFSEFSEEGRKLEQQLLEIAHRRDMRLVGPNCISVVNQEIGLCLPFAPISPATARLGPASVISQSGGVSVTYMDMLCTSGVGVNKAVSIGNKANLDEADYLSYLLQDPGTQIICLYLESINDGRELLRLAASSTKPIIVHKANRSQASERVAFSHTAALADDDRIVSAAFRQAGIFRSENFRESVAIAQGLSLPPVRGNNLVIISRSGGHAVIAADAAERYGFRLAPLPSEFLERVHAFFRADVIAITNPIDLGVIFDFDLYAKIVEECLRMLSPDAVLLVNTYSLEEAEGAHRLARRVEEIVKESGRPIAFCVYSQGDEKQVTQQYTSLPVFAEIEDALQGLAASRAWNSRRERFIEKASGAMRQPLKEAEQMLSRSGALTADQALSLCKLYDIPIAPFEVASDPDAAAEAARRLGYPVALKALATELVHKSDVGGVALGLADGVAIRREAEAMLIRIAHPARLMVQRMVSGGLEVILGGKRDRGFGPVVMFGLGGVFVEVFDDVAFRVAPLSRIDAQEMIEEIRGKRLLEGARGKPPLDREALVKA
ncbi:MAG TPA: acetate--CoA ligase family protein, partial [Candidatus Acidoferrum sp.]|nr:acetate--CoA ligase family protein [Candidatus Acidoferrum sp.]